MRAWVVSALCALPALAAAPALATPLDELLRKIQSAGQHTRTLQASFVQRKRMPMFKSEVVTKGRMAFARPDRLRWETLAPDAAVLVLRGEHAELRLPGEPARGLDLKAGSALGSLVDQMLVWFGVRPASELHKHYQVTLRGTGAEPQLRLVPRDEALRKRVAAIDISLGKDLSPTRIQVSAGEEITRIELGAVKRNVSLPDSTFR